MKECGGSISLPLWHPYFGSFSCIMNNNSGKKGQVSFFTAFKGPEALVHDLTLLF